MKLRSVSGIYFPPQLILEYERRSGKPTTRHIDVSQLFLNSKKSAQGDSSTAIAEELTDAIVASEPHVGVKYRKGVSRLVQSIAAKLTEEYREDVPFQAFCHTDSQPLPITNIAATKQGDRVASGSYDRTCKIWDSSTARVLASLEDHSEVVYAVAFNPLGNRVVTGSFDTTAKLWDADTGQCLETLAGHSAELMCVAFAPTNDAVATCSNDCLVKIWDAETGDELGPLKGHEAEIMGVTFDHTGATLLTSSFDGTARLWDLKNGSCVRVFKGHEKELTCSDLARSGTLCATGSTDCTVKVWDVGSGKCLHQVSDYKKEVTSVGFDASETLVCSASADGSGRVVWISQADAVRFEVAQEGSSDGEGEGDDPVKLTRARVAASGKVIVAAGSDGNCYSFCPKTGKLLQRMLGANACDSTMPLFDVNINYDCTGLLGVSQERIFSWKRKTKDEDEDE